MISVAYVSPDGALLESFEMENGRTLHQAALELCPDTGGLFPAPVVAVVGSRPAVRALGDWDYALDDAQVEFRLLAMGGGGGGSNPLQVVMQVAVIALAAAATWGVGGVAGWSVFGAVGTLGLGATAGALAGIGVMLLGTMLMGALFPQQMPQGLSGSRNAEQASPTYSINASGNQARLFQQEPEGFGRMKIVPDFVSNTWTQYVGNDQYGYFVYGIGRGRYQIESLQFGETVFWRNGALVAGTGYEIVDLQFVEPGGTVTIFPDNVVTSDEVNGQELFAPNNEEYEGAIGPYATNPAGTQTTKLLFDFILQRGIGYYDDEGNLQHYSVTWTVEYQRIDDFGNALSEWAALDTPTFGGSTLTPQRITKTYNVAAGRYQCRVRRTSNTRGDGRTMDSLVWGAMRGMLPGTYAYPQSCIALIIKANNALTQTASRQFSAIVVRKLPLYNRNSRTWSEETPTRSWAAAVSHVCKIEWGGRLRDANIDLDTLWAIDARLQAKGWHYDAYIDGPYLVWALLNEMCQSQCVIPRLIGPVLSFVEDGPNRTPSFALTPRNIVRNSFGVNYVTWSDETPDDVTIDYLDAAYGFQQRDVTATLPESESEAPTGLSVLGITDRNHAHKVAVAYAAHNRWQRVVVDCQVEMLGRIINKGDVCTVAHPRFRNTASGAVEAWREDVLSMVLQQDMTWLTPEGSGDAGDGLYLALSRQDGTIWGPCKLSLLDGKTAYLDRSDYGTLLLQGQGNPFEWLTTGEDRQPTAWTLYTGRTCRRLMVVQSVSAQDMLHYTLKLVNYDERIYGYDDLPIPPWQGRDQLPTLDSLSAPGGFRGIILGDGRVSLVWTTVAGADWYDVETSADNASWINQGRALVSQLTVAATGMLYARVRAATDTLQSPWSTWKGDADIPPPDAPVLTAATPYRAGAADVIWDAVPHAESYAVSLLHDGQSVYTTVRDDPGMTITPEMQEGGPYRTLSVSVTAVGLAGASSAAVLELHDSAPAEITDAVIEVGADSLTLQSVTPDEADDKTGYVLIKGTGPNFTLYDVLELRQIQTLPYVWSGLEIGTHHFRTAVKDAFYDIARNPLDLNWSAVLSITVGDASEEGGEHA